jgi:hypothetical protein
LADAAAVKAGFVLVLDTITAGAWAWCAHAATVDVSFILVFSSVTAGSTAGTSCSTAVNSVLVLVLNAVAARLVSNTGSRVKPIDACETRATRIKGAVVNIILAVAS